MSNELNTKTMNSDHPAVITGGRVLTTEGWKDCDIQMKDGLTDFLAPAGSLEKEGAPTFHAEGLTVLPGFLDVHTHGACNVDGNKASVDDLRKSGRFFASHGVTGWHCSILTDTPESTFRAIAEARKVIEAPVEPDGARLLGIHLEGPCLSQEYRGSMPSYLLLDRVDPAFFKQYQEAAGGHVTYLTVSPELEGAAQAIPALSAMGIRVAIGHSGATYDEAWASIRAGAVAGTHVGNATRLFHQHEPSIFGAVLESDLYCETICDGIHLHPGSVRLFYKTKGLDRMVAITDSIMAAGMPDGTYTLGVNTVIVKNGDAKLADGTRAGSTLTMDRALRNIIAFTGLSLRDASRWTSTNPARMMGWEDRGKIAPGACADYVLLDENLNVAATIVGGRLVYEAHL